MASFLCKAHPSTCAAFSRLAVLQHVPLSYGAVITRSPHKDKPACTSQIIFLNDESTWKHLILVKRSSCGVKRNEMVLVSLEAGVEVVSKLQPRAPLLFWPKQSAGRFLARSLSDTERVNPYRRGTMRCRPLPSHTPPAVSSCSTDMAKTYRHYRR
jgi:hypothetical protein